MRFIEREKPQWGHRRSRSGFLFVPKKIRRETRWLEWAVWEQVYTYKYYDFGVVSYWENVRWL